MMNDYENQENGMNNTPTDETPQTYNDQPQGGNLPVNDYPAQDQQQYSYQPQDNQQQYYQPQNSQQQYYQPQDNQQPQNNYQPQYQPQYNTTPTNGKAVASLVLGIASVVLMFFGWTAIVSIILAIVGIILGVGARKEIGPNEGRGLATAGLVCSIISLVLSAIVFISCVICASALASYGYYGW
jgi:DNA mismatch repair ATPase MutL